MRVASINTVAMRSNAPGRLMLDINNAVVGNKGQALVMFGRGDVSHASAVKNVKTSGDFDTLSHALMSRLNDSEGLHSKIATRAMVARLSDFTPDIIHLHNLHGHYLNYPILFDYLRRIDTPIVWTMHDCWAFTGHCAYYAANGCEGIADGCVNCHHRRDYPCSLLSRSGENFNRKVNAFKGVRNMSVVAVSHWLADQLSKSFLGTYPVSIIPNGIDTDVFSPVQPLSPRRKFTILGVAARWDKRKNLRFFIELSKRLPDDCEIKLVGLTRLQRVGLPGGIKAVGGIHDNRDLARVYSESDLFINPSLAETFGMTTVEAMACGTPVIVNNVTALPETVVDGAGFSIDINDMEGVLALISRFRGVEKPVEVCRSHVVSSYSVKAMTDAYLTLYGELLGD